MSLLFCSSYNTSGIATVTTKRHHLAHVFMLNALLEVGSSHLQVSLGKTLKFILLVKLAPCMELLSSVCERVNKKQV